MDKSKDHSLKPATAGAILCLAVLLGMSLWFTASAVTPQLQLRWQLGAGTAGWLTTAVQLGFVAGTATAAVLNLADLWPARTLVAASCVLAALANGLVVATGSFPFAIVMRFLTGFFLAGVYPPGMKMMATWFVTNRGLAIGALVGALTVGKAMPYLIRGVELSANLVVLSTSVAAVVAALLIWTLYHDGPHTFERRPFSWKLVSTVAAHRETRLAIAGYLGHMWELYAMWTVIAVFFFDYFMVADLTRTAAFTRSGLIAFAAIAVGGVGSVLAGKWADRLGRERITIWSMAVSGACALTMGWLIAAPPALTITVALIWGFAVVADSAQFSALVTEVAPKHAVGTALALQTSLGFLLTAFTIWLTLEISRSDWRIAFGLLAIGPALGIVAMLRLKRLRALAHS